MARRKTMVAALFVQTNGVYYNLPNVDPWDEERDARRYSGPWPVVAHPPCARWGRYWSGGPQATGRFELGADDGKFGSAAHSTRTWGGVLEHPKDSHAWPTFGIKAPPPQGGWVEAGDGMGFTCCVEQGWYGHAAQKPTWLYVCRVEPGALPNLMWGSSKPIVEGRMASAGRKITRRGILEMMSRKQRAATPVPFRDLLLGMAPAEEDKSKMPKVPRYTVPLDTDEPTPGFRDVLLAIARSVR